MLSRARSQVTLTSQVKSQRSQFETPIKPEPQRTNSYVHLSHLAPQLKLTNHQPETLEAQRRVPILNQSASMRTFRHSAKPGIDEYIKPKLSHEWRNIYRRLVQLQPSNSENGQVSVALFNKVCVQFGVILTHEEVAKLTNLDGKINFRQLSKDVLGPECESQLKRIQGLNPLQQIPKEDIEVVFQRSASSKKFKIPRKMRVYHLCRMADKNELGTVPFSEFKRICDSCNMQVPIATSKMQNVRYDFLSSVQ